MSVLAVGWLCAVLAAVVGGATGFGTAMVGTPLMLLAGMDVTAVVVVNLASGILTRSYVLVRLRKQMNRARVAALCGGALPGAVVGALVVAHVPTPLLRDLAGLATVICGIWLAIPAVRPTPEPGVTATSLTGAVGGFLTTTTSLGGPPPVLLLQRARVPPLTFIADMAGYFVVTCGVSLVLLAVTGGVPASVTAGMVGLFMLGSVVGNVVGLWIGERIPAVAFRRIVIGLVVLAGLAALLS